MPDPIPPPPPSSFSPLHQANVLQKAKPGFPWVESALLVSAAALLTISILSNIDVIHHVGTLSAHFVANAALYGGITLTAAATIIVLVRHYEETTQRQNVITEEQGQKKPHLIDSNKQVAALHRPIGNSESKPCEINCQLKGGQTVTLYGVFDATEDLDEQLLLARDKLSLTNEVEEIKKMLNEIPADVVLKMEDKAIVSAKSYYVLNDSNYEHRSLDEIGMVKFQAEPFPKDYDCTLAEGSMKMTFEIPLSDKTGEQLLILGSPNAIRSLNHEFITRHAKRAIDRITPAEAYSVKGKLISAMDSFRNQSSKEEFSLIVLELSKQP